MRYEKPICFFDLETTGTSTTQDRIIEIAIIKIEEGKNDTSLHMMINPEIPITESATAIHGITNDMVKDCATFKDVAKEIFDFMNGCDIGGYNSNRFDIPFLSNEFSRVGIDWDLSSANFIDVCTIFKRMEERTLSAAVKFYLDREHTGAHGALEDVSATIEVFNAQLSLYQNSIPETVKELDLYCNYDKQRVDLAGCFSIDADGDYVLTFGKHAGKKAKLNKDYLQWMVGNTFNKDTKDICTKILKS